MADSEIVADAVRMLESANKRTQKMHQAATTLNSAVGNLCELLIKVAEKAGGDLANEVIEKSKEVRAACDDLHGSLDDLVAFEDGSHLLRRFQGHATKRSRVDEVIESQAPKDSK